MSSISLVNILGAGDDHLTKVELAIRAELTLRLAAESKCAICPISMVENSLKTVAIGEKLPTELRNQILMIR